MNEPDVDSIKIKFDKDVKKIKSNALISIAASDKNLKKMKVRANILGNKFAGFSRENMRQDQRIQYIKFT